MADSREIEAKFTAPEETIRQLLAATSAGPFSLSQSGSAWQDDLYFDTAFGQLRSSGSSLRIRRSEDAAVMTFKGDRRAVGNAVSRLEDEVPLSPDEQHQAGDRSVEIHPPPPPLERARHIVGGEALLPVAHLRTYRTVLLATSVDALVELSIDRCTGTRLRDSRTVEFVEIEAELKKGDESDLRAFGTSLVESFPGLQPSSLTKLGRTLGDGVPD